MECKLCDTVKVEFPKYGMSGRFKIVKTVYDVLQERFTEMELGTLSVTLSEALGITNTLDSGSGGSLKIKTADVSGTTNAQGAISLSAISSASHVIGVSCTNQANAMCIPWLYNNATWYAKVVNWQSLSAMASTSVDLKVTYIE